MKRFHVMVAVVALVGMTITAEAQRQSGLIPYFGPRSLERLLTISSVQNELNLTAEQKEELEALRDRGVHRIVNLPYLSREEQQQKFQEVGKPFKAVLDEKQQIRLEELHIQHDGAFVLALAEIAEKVGLEQAQKEKIKKILDDASIEQGNRPLTSDQELVKKYFAEARERGKKAKVEILAVLTTAQKETFEKMQGAKFTFN